MWGIRSNTSQMWTIRPYSSHLWHIRQNASHVKNPTDFLTPIFARKTTCKMFDRLYQTWDEIQWYTAQMLKNRSNSYKLWHTGQKTWHVKNPTKFLTPIFAENIKCKVPTEYVKHEEYDRILHRCEQFDQIRQSHHIFSRIHHMGKIRPNFSHYILPKCVKWKKFDRICHLWGIRSNTLQLWNYGKMFDRLYQTWDEIQWYTAQMLKNRSNSYKFWHTGQKTWHVKNPTKFLTPTFAENIKCKVPTEYVKHEEYDRILHRCEQFDQIRQSHHIFSRIHHMGKIRPNFSHYILPKCVKCKKFDRICHLWGIRSNTLQLWNYGKIDLIRHTFVTHLTENITYEKYVPVSHTYNSPKCVTCNTSDQIYLARDKFDRKLPCCKNNSTELFIVVTYLTKYMTCEKSNRISHTYISPKMFPFIKMCLLVCKQ